MRRRSFLSVPLVSLATVALLAAALAGAASAQDGNVLLIIADDVGIDTIGAYQSLEGSTNVPSTPTINGLANAGITFKHVWSNPRCATTRATIQTGRYGHRTGVVHYYETLPLDELTIPEALDADASIDVEHAVFGKWGLASPVETKHAVQSGYDHFAGKPDCCIHGGYENWTRTEAEFNDTLPTCDEPKIHSNENCVEESTATEPVYATTRNVDDARDWINALHAADPNQHWFVVLTFNAAHEPHVPNPPGYTGGSDPKEVYRGIIEHMDAEIGRLLDPVTGIPTAVYDETTIIFVGDNGPPAGQSDPPFRSNRAKPTLYETGINVPLIISGAAVEGSVRVAYDLVNTVDLFQTILDIFGVDPAALPPSFPPPANEWRAFDSVSLEPILADPCTPECTVTSPRTYAFAEDEHGGKAVRNADGYKLTHHNDSPFPYPFPWEFFLLPDQGALGPQNTFQMQDQHNLVDWDTGELLEADPTLQAILDDLTAVLGPPGEPPGLPPVNIGSAPECIDGLDNDNDGFIDFGSDPDCASEIDNREKAGQCGLGYEVAPLLLVLMALRGWRRRGIRSSL